MLTPSVLTPSVLTLSVAGAGVFMLVMGDLLGRRALDVSAVTISLAGLAALLMARGLHRRVKAAWAATLALLTTVTAIAAAHGDPVLVAVTAVLALCWRRRARRSTAAPSSPGARTRSGRSP